MRTPLTKHIYNSFTEIQTRPKNLKSKIQIFLKFFDFTKLTELQIQKMYQGPETQAVKSVTDIDFDNV